MLKETAERVYNWCFGPAPAKTPPVQLDENGHQLEIQVVSYKARVSDRPSSTKKPWECSVCNRLNAPEWKQCGTCYTVEGYIFEKQRIQMEQSASLIEWTCQVCHRANEPTATQCSICYTKRDYVGKHMGIGSIPGSRI